mmetsp:Transcript_35476/g.67980  ORF Transcript_35476/g.67980 Transcript_35476/m.67980 type:complete len:384 (-) Transcript_35476:358-1509(-)
MSGNDTAGVSRASLAALKEFVPLLRARPQLARHPDLLFFRDLLRDWGAAIPPDAPEPTRKDDEEACENDTELVDPDQDPAQPMGAPADSELTEREEEALSEHRAKAAEAAEAGLWEDAVAAFTAALQMRGSAMVYAKRAEAYVHMKKPNAALRDAKAALEINPDSAKAFKCKGVAHRMLGQYDQALKDLGTGLSIDYDEASYHVQQGVTALVQARKQKQKAKADAARKAQEEEQARRARAAEEARTQQQQSQSSQGSGGGFPGMGGMGGFPGMSGMGGMPGMGGLPPELMAKLMGDPELQAAMMNPKVMAAMQECMSDPSKIMQYQSDPDIQKVIMKLMGMGLGGMGGMGGMGGGMGAQQAPSFDEESTASQPPRPTSVEEVD